MLNKAVYILVGFIAGIIIVLALKNPGKPIYALEPANSGVGSSNDYIAITTNTAKTLKTILWVLDLKRSNLVVYEYDDGNNRIKLAAFRDIEYDLDIPSGYAGFDVLQNNAPLDVKKAYEDVRKKLNPQENTKK
jgi:hypothetical protein